MPTGSPRSLAFRLVRAGVIVVLVVVLVPYMLVPLYRFVDPVSTLMLGRRITGERVERVWVPLDHHVADAAALRDLVAEDARFCTHRGIDFGELRAAMEDADDISEMRGGSTIAQQTAKNLFLWQGRSVVRKALEFPLALWLDLVLGKRRVMEIYLDIAEWGPDGEFGAEAASAACLRQIGPRSERTRGGTARRDPAQSGAPQRRAPRRRREPAGRDL